MRRLEVLLTQNCHADLDQIALFLAGLGASDAIAEGFVRRIVARCRSIGDAPHGGRRRDDLEPGLRMVGFERRAVILYHSSADAVHVQRVFYAGRDDESWYRCD